jgi:hypothetical protein
VLVWLFPHCSANYFTQYIPSTFVKTISIGDGHPLPIAGKGSVTFKSQLPDSIQTAKSGQASRWILVYFELLAVEEWLCENFFLSFFSFQSMFILHEGVAL